jgi:hypothetical protein
MAGDHQPARAYGGEEEESVVSHRSKGPEGHMSAQDRRVARAVAITFAILACISIPVILIAVMRGCDTSGRASLERTP